MMDKIILVGTGQMAVDYVKVLTAQGREFQVVGRGIPSANTFKEATGIQPFTGGIDSFLETNAVAAGTKFIIATGTEILMPVLKKVLLSGAGNVLIEKPAAISIGELLENEEFLSPYSHKVFIAYNRRFYASVLEAQRLIDEDGGLQSMHFEFTEWAHKIEPISKPPGVKENWFFANSTHVVDLAFYLGGNPLTWNTFSKSGKISWHDKTNFAGAGITEKEVLFSYISNWESAGRWAVELFTMNRRIYLRPLEGIQIQLKGSVALTHHQFDDQRDIDFKPGLYAQVEAFADSQHSELCSIAQHISNSKNNYLRILS